MNNLYIELLKKDGGFSLDTNNKTPKNGYMLAIKGFEKTFNIKDSNKIMMYCLELKNKILKGQYVGGWFNREDNKIYIDVSENITDKKEAIKKAKVRNELAIWDIEKFKEIKVN